MCMKINDFKAKFIEKCKTPTIRIMIFIILICSISVAYLFINRIKPDFKTIPNTFTIYDGKDIKLKANYKLNVNVNIKMLKKWKIKMYIFQLVLLRLCLQKGSLFPKTI